MRTADILVRVAANGAIETAAHLDRVTTGPHGLAVLDCFTQPRTMAEALQILGPRCKSASDWADLAGTIAALHRCNVLHEAGRPMPTRAFAEHRFDRPGVHVRMLNDRIRTGLYLDALREVIRADDVVVDLGTGSGVLAVAAAQSGARHVYAIEGSGIATVAEEVVRLSGLTDVVTVMRGRSTQLSLPERATVVVSEIIGNDPFGEGALEFLRDAALRLSAPGARFIPSSLELFLVPVTVRQEYAADRLATPDRIGAWRDWYGMDLSPLAAVPFEGWERTSLGSRDFASVEALGPPASLGSFTLGDPHTFPITREVLLRIDRDGHLGGIALFFEAQLSPRTRLSLDPGLRQRSSWTVPLWLRASPVAVQAGDTFTCGYRYDSTSELRISRTDGPRAAP